MTMVINSASRLKMTMAAHIRKKRWISMHSMGRTMLMVKHSIMVTTAMMVMTTMGFRVAAFAERRADQHDLLGQTRS